MQIQSRALYNLLRMNWLEDATLKVEPWQVEDYRALREAELFSRLKSLDIVLSKESFLAYAENCETPEDLVDCLWLKEEDALGMDKVYLLVFELWRRFLPERQSLSIFCDELDFRIFLYDANALKDDEPIQEILAVLESVLEENVDKGVEPQEVFQLVAGYCAHDLESFIYDYISEQIDQKNGLFASELLDGFYPYIANEEWFEFLKIRLLAETDAEGASLMLSGLVEELQEKPDSGLLLEIDSFLKNANWSEI